MWTLVERVEGRGSGLVRLLGPLLLATACSEGPFLMTEEYVSGEDGEQYVGGGCISTQKGNGMSGGNGAATGHGGDDGSNRESRGLSYSYDGTGAAVRFMVTNSAGLVLAERSYAPPFLASGTRDEVVLDVTGGKMRFVHWGAPKCAEPREPDPR